jgi:hypothetical protein
MFGNDLYTVEIENVWNSIRTKRRLLIPARSREDASFKVGAYLFDLNWPAVGEYLEDKKQWYISKAIEKVPLLQLMSSPSAVRLGSDISFFSLGMAKEVKLATPEESLAFKQQDDIDPEFDPADNCMDCLEDTCFTCLFFHDDI